MGEDIRRSLDTTDWDAAQQRVRGWEAMGKVRDDIVPDDRVTISYAVQKFLADARARDVSPGSVRKFEVLLCERLGAFCTERGLQYLNELTAYLMRNFRSSWRISPAAPQNKAKHEVRSLGALTVAKSLERLRQFFRFCVDNDWIGKNPAKPIKAPTADQRPTLPFTAEEMGSILTAAADNPRLRAMVLLLRHSGLRIGDAVTLSRDRVRDGRLLVYTAKTGTPVHLPLPPEVIKALDQCPSRNQRFFFWTGEGGADTATNNWRDDITRLCRRAEVAGGRPHRFRDTFAVEMLARGVPIEAVSAALGHSDIKVTARHYSPWVKARQDALDAAVRAAWA